MEELQLLCYSELSISSSRLYASDGLTWKWGVLVKSSTDSGLLLHFLLTNVIIVSCFGQKRLLNALIVNVK